MSVRDTVRRQYQAIVDRTAGQTPAAPPEGFIATVRKALGMTGPQLAKRLGITRPGLFQIERGEVDGTVTLKTMRAAAEAMGCRFVYAIVPESGKIEDVIAAQARKKTRAIVGRASTHMALEKQALTAEQDAEQIERMAQDMVREMPRDLWSDE
jgi:predicted DNA-binding mobile mystery protein A